MVQAGEQSPRFEWLEAAGISHEQLARECVEQLCYGGQDETLGGSFAPLPPPQEESQRLLECRKFLQNVACRIIENKLTLEQCTALVQGSGFTGGSALYAATRERQAAVREVLVRRALAPLPCLLDFDWNVKLAVASSSVATLQEPLLNLVLRTTSSSTGPPTGTTSHPSTTSSSNASEFPSSAGNSCNLGAGENIFAELSLEQVEELIAALKNVQCKMVKCT
ncbi:uncharacterized protein LOC108680471 [Hyalella azteca]|uniref:Uncharacterized protein LOC108680471 n=1 Tax=Hyalella azteca TaxID=294128 RepID=A0A8B7PGU4_HYAAZ|nr:uncharacterized protein LOC108680471 [Hyalella azteca]